MRIGRVSNGISCEYAMQAKMEEWLKQHRLKYKSELRVPEVSRRADFLLLKRTTLINIEAKCNNLKCMLSQLTDHAKYCDYCFAFVPDYCNTPEWFKAELFKSKFGLIIYNYKTGQITEVIEAHHNNNLDLLLKRKVVSQILNRPIKIRRTIFN